MRNLFSSLASPFCSLVLLLSAGANCVLADSSMIKGKVINSEGKAIGGVKIVLHDNDTHQEITGRSDGEGDFEIEHAQCSSLSFDVFPPPRSGLAVAHYANVSGDVTKHFIVQLHRGFKVTGRILAEGQGVGGLEIKVVGVDGEGKHATVHGGGVARTKGNGEYTLMLTPGKKIIQIKNDVYSNLSPVYQHEFTITGNVRLPDMTLPLVQEK